MTATELNGIASGTAPDIMELGTGGGPMAGIPGVWALGPDRADLTGQPWVKQVWRPLLSLLMVAGEVDAVPLANSVYSVDYNKDLFTRLGLTPPATWTNCWPTVPGSPPRGRCRSSSRAPTP